MLGSGWFRSWVAPLLALFTLPVLAVWFALHVTRSLDLEVQGQALAAIEADASLGEAERAQLSQFYAEVPMSAVCAGSVPGTEELAADLADLCSMHGYFRWIFRLGAASGLVGLGMVLVGVGAVLVARRGEGAQVPAYFVGWNAMKWGSSLQIITQGALMVLLSYWVSVWFFNVYVPKLIILVALLVLVGVGVALMALWRRIDLTSELRGALISEADAPKLWARVRELAQRIGTAAPQQIVGGIDDSFFVTEGRMRVDGQLLTGRTLFVSLGLLRALPRDQADAVLAHELGHFAGGDTARTVRLTPALARTEHFLGALEGQAVAWVATPVLWSFYHHFMLAISANSRTRELAADAVAAAQTSGLAISSALLRVTAYGRYRGEVERQLFAHQELLTELGIAGRVQAGFLGYVRGLASPTALVDDQLAHPFDRHPTTRDRMAAVNVSLDGAQVAEILATEVSDSWVDDIPVAAEVEAKLWAIYEAEFRAAHEYALAVRYRPDTDAEREIVERHFPELVIGKDDKVVCKVSYAALTYQDWASPLPWSEIVSITKTDGTFGDVLDFVTKTQGKLRLKLRPLGKGQAEFLQKMPQYWNRDTFMREHQANLAIVAIAELAGAPSEEPPA